MKRNGRVAIVETKIPEPKTRVQRIYQKLLKQSASFFDKYSDLLMPTVGRFFEQIEVEHAPNINAIAFLGKRRDVVLSAPSN